MPFAVMLVNPEHLDAIRTRWGSDGTILVFTESEILHALDTIRQRPPKVLVLNPTLATTSRSAMIVAQVKRDPRLREIELRVLNEHDDRLPLLTGRDTPAEMVLRDISQPLDHCGTRQVVRWKIRDGLELRINGERGRVADLSSSGAQIVVGTSLRPQATVRFTLFDDSDEIRLRARVAWSTADTAGPQLRYRAGIEFLNAQPELLEVFCIRHGSSSEHELATGPATSIQTAL